MAFIGRFFLSARPKVRWRITENAMFDIVYITIGAAFLFGCVLYAYACDAL